MCVSSIKIKLNDIDNKAKSKSVVYVYGQHSCDLYLYPIMIRMIASMYCNTNMTIYMANVKYVSSLFR